jgi:hypothetical protein
MAQHKWHKEIKAWADGAEIETKYIESDVWLTDTDEPYFWLEDFEFRIKPQPKDEKPKYLYVWLDKDTKLPQLETYKPRGVLEDNLYKYIGKIKLENDNGND